MRNRAKIRVMGGLAIENNTMAMGGGTVGISAAGGNPDIVRNAICGAKWGIVVAGGAPSIRDHNRIENNTVPGQGYGLYVTSTSPFDVTDNNTFSNNLKAGIYLGAGTNVAIRDNNTISGNHYGIWINKSAVVFANQTWWNDIEGNDVGIYAEDPGTGYYFHAECNYWNNLSGPFDNSTGSPDYNPLGQGQYVSDFFHYRNEITNDPYWLKQTSLTATSCKA